MAEAASVDETVVSSYSDTLLMMLLNLGFPYVFQGIGNRRLSVRGPSRDRIADDGDRA